MIFLLCSWDFLFGVHEKVGPALRKERLTVPLEHERETERGSHFTPFYETPKTPNRTMKKAICVSRL